jgi:hypothetical protein
MNASSRWRLRKTPRSQRLVILSRVLLSHTEQELHDSVDAFLLTFKVYILLMEAVSFPKGVGNYDNTQPNIRYM